MTLMTGPTRTGKSALTYGVIAQATRHPNVKVVGVDFTGVTFRPFPACSLRAVGPDPVTAYTTLDNLIREMDRRLDHLSELGVDSLSQHFAHYPIYLVVAEEWPGLIAQARLADLDRERGRPAIATALLAALQRLVAESAKTNFRIWLLAQRADAELIGGFARSNFLRRISFGGELAALKMMIDDIDPVMVTELRRLPIGGAVIDSPAGRALFRADLAKYPDYFRAIITQGCCGVRGAQTPHGGACASRDRARNPHDD